MKLSNIFAASVAAFIIGGAANAATTVVCEGGGPGTNPEAGGFTCDATFNDFGPNPASNVFDITGHTLVFGGITQLNDSLYQDAWTFNFDGLYNVEFSWVSTPDPNSFQGTFSVDGDTTGFGPGDSTLTYFNQGPGAVSFVIDAAGLGEARQNAYWKVEVSAVPLPAAGWLLLAGVGGLAAMKRKKRNA
ncbi:MAG: VPLPA-CTERM sorting domain-containing protein [Pseudomonadota bacterium]